MKNLIKTFTVLFCASILSYSCASKEDETTMETPKSIYELAAADSDLSSLKAAVDKAGLSATLSGSGTFTVFAPSNAAFSQFLTANGFASLNDVPNAVLKEV